MHMLLNSLEVNGLDMVLVFLDRHKTNRLFPVLQAVVSCC